MGEEIINLDALVPKTITFTKTINGESRSWHLRDEMPPEVLLPVLRLMLRDTERSRTALPTSGADGAIDGEAALALFGAALDAQISETLSTFATLWHCSYPQDATEDLAVWFSHKERQAILQLFFTRHSSASSTPSNATTPAATTEAPAMPPTPNREQRRTTRSPRGAIPSQKRLSRELRGM